MVGATEYSNLNVIEDPEMTAGESGQALLGFTYEGDQYPGEEDPFVLNITFEDEDTKGEHFEAEGELRFEEGGSQRSYELECSSGESVESRGGVGDFYEGSLDQIDEDGLFCFTKDAITVLPSYQVVDGEVALNITPDVRTAPDDYSISYTFAGWAGLPEFDPVVNTGENGVIDESSHELLEDRGIKLEADPGINFTIVGYNYINAENDRPGSEEFVLNYYELRPHQDTSGRIELEYDQERVDSREREDPRLYGCRFEDQDCSWELIAQGENGVIETESEFDYSLYGIFTSNVIEREIIRDDGGGSSSSGGGSVSIDNEENNKSEESEEDSDDEPETVEVQKPTAFFDVEYTDAEMSENVRFDASNSYSPNSEIEAYEWSFNASGPQAVQSFEQDEVNVTLTVTDEEGGQDSYSQVINFEQVETEQNDTSNQEGLTGGFAQSAFNPRNLISALQDFISNIF